MIGALRSFGLLLADAFADALRRRVVIVIALLALLMLSTIESCTGSTVFEINGREMEMAPYLAPGLFTLLAFAVIILAGVLASDHLARPLGEGSAELWLARPISRTSYAAARLGGTLGISLSLAALLLGSATGLSHVRSGLPMGPGFLGALACAGGATLVASLTMAASLVLPRIAAVLLLMVTVPWLLAVNALSLLGVEFEGPVTVAIQEWGPPLFTTVILAVLPWNQGMEVPGGGLEAALRLAAWTALGPALLLIAFRRLEL